MKVLILGGTTEARLLADELVARRHDVTSSLAGRTQQPQLPAGRIRVGKFGGIPGLVGYLGSLGFDRLIDATHPYAGLISINAVAAAQQTGVPLIRFMRPAWSEPPGAGWVHVADVKAAADTLPSGAVALITTGHEGLEHFVERDDCRLIVRLIEPPDMALPAHARLVLGRPPYGLADERTLFANESVTHLVTKNSGGAMAAKLEAANEVGARVIVIARPTYGPAREVATLDEALAALAED